METLHATTATSAPVTDILHVYKFGPFVPLPEATSSLLDAALILGKHGMHRVCVVNEGTFMRVRVRVPLCAPACAAAGCGPFPT
jgi:hypothetical protein